MGELHDILGAMQRHPAVLATVVSVAGSTYRRPGARMLFPRDAPPIGLLSGGCLEADLAERAEAVRESGEARTVVYDMRSPDDIVWGLGLGCNGEVRVLLERTTPEEPPEYIGLLEDCEHRRRPGLLATVFELEGPQAARVGERIRLAPGVEPAIGVSDPQLAQAIARDAADALAARRSSVRSYEIPSGRARVLLEYLVPPIALLVFGAGSDAVPLVRLAKELGWRVTVADDRPAFVRDDRFPAADAVELVRFDALERPEIDDGTAVVVMTHHFVHDLELLRYLVRTPAAYLGFLGPRQRTENLLAQLAERGVRLTDEQRGRIYGPVGIDIGSETPEEIALSVVAEIRAAFSGRSGGFLRNSRAPLHDWAS